MIIDDNFNYIVLSVFEKLYMYENKRSISVDKLKGFRRAMLQEILDIYKNNDPDYFYLQEVDQWHGDVSFKEIDEDESLAAFLEEFGEYFYLDNDRICLREHVTYYDISELLKQVRIKENVPGRFNIIDGNDGLMAMLDIKSIKKIIARYSKIEERLEKLYYKLYTDEDSEDLRKEISSLLLMRYNFFNRIAQMPSYRVNAFRLTAINYYIETDCYDYDKFPIDLELWRKECADPEDFLADINDRVYDITQYAIFGKKHNPLYLHKIDEDLEEYHFSNCLFNGATNNKTIDPLKDYTDEIETRMMAIEQFEDASENNPESVVMLYDPSDEFWVLYMNYLKNLNRFMAIFGESEELLFAKKRLLYALDKPDTMIFDEERFEIELDKTKTIELDEDPFDFFLEEIYFIAQEVFRVNPDEYTIRKILLVATYYDLTKDEELKRIIEKFKNHPQYDFFYEVMINNCSNIDPNMLFQGRKLLTFKPIDSSNLPK